MGHLEWRGHGDIYPGEFEAELDGFFAVNLVDSEEQHVADITLTEAHYEEGSLTLEQAWTADIEVTGIEDAP